MEGLEAIQAQVANPTSTTRDGSEENVVIKDLSSSAIRARVDYLTDVSKQEETLRVLEKIYFRSDKCHRHLRRALPTVDFSLLSRLWVRSLIRYMIDTH